MRGLRCLLGVLAMAVCLLVVGGGVALAVPASFGSGEGEEAGQFEEPFGIAVEQESGDVYVADSFNERVDKFGPGGEFLFAWGWGVADGHTEASQTCTASCFAGVSGGGSGELDRPAGVAVDNDPLSASHGDVYVVDTRNARVEKFDSAGSLLLMFGGGVNETTSGDVCLAGEACRAGTEGTEPGQFEQLAGGIAVDAAGDVFVGDLNRVQEFSPGGVYVGQVTIPGAASIGAMAVDSSGDVYVQANGLSGVRKFNGAGTELGEPLDASGGPGVIALGPSGELFVSDRSGGYRHVLEYDSAGAEVASFDAVNENEGGFRTYAVGGLAFGEHAGGLFELDHRQVTVRFFPSLPPGPLVVSEGSGELQPTTASVSAVVNPEGHETTYHVEYGTTVSYGSSTTPGTLGGSAFEDEPVSVALSGLQPRTTYHFRVVASNSAGTTFGEDQSFTTLPPALIDSESVSEVTASSATLAAQINPLGRDTTYRLEYGLSTAYGASVPVPDGDAGSGGSDVALSALVENLTPGTAYHFRVVASNSLGTVEGADRVFTTQIGEAPVLPDGRAWEMVSPPDKRGAALEAIGVSGGADIQAAADGGAITYAAQSPVGDEPRGNRSIEFTQVLSTRTAGGWSSLDVTTPHEALVGFEGSSEYKVFSPDLSAGLVEPAGEPLLSPQATEKTPYRREAGGGYTPLVTAADVPSGVQFGHMVQYQAGIVVGEGPGVEFSGASPDLSRVILRSPLPLIEGIPAQSGPNQNRYSNLFEWYAGTLRLVSVLPNGRAASEEGLIAKLGADPGADGRNVRHAVSSDGSRVFWEAAAEFGSSLYMRDLNGDGGRGETIQLDAVQAAAPGGGGTPQFQVASNDGLRAFFADESRLTADSTARAGKRDLYMCDIGVVAGRAACHLKDATVDRNTGEAADVQGTVLGTGEDGRYAYFVANGVLAAGAVPGGCVGGIPGGVCNLYVYDAVLGETRFIAQLPARDEGDWTASGLGYLTAGVSPDGRYLAFMSEKSLTGYDNIDARSGQRDEEVFLYDASTGHLTCASCNPSGARPSGVFDSGEFPGLLVDHRSTWRGHWLAGSLPGWTNLDGQGDAFYRSRYLSDSGRLFFDGADALVPRDGNGKEDVYEYEPSGVGGCAKADGCVGLITSGTSSEESVFMDASESGNDVFFLTASQLVPQDLDNALDLYDARVCTSSSPCLASPAAPPVPCATADSCRAAPSSQPGVFGAPPSATFSGAGNPQPAVAKTVARKMTVSMAQKRAAALRKCRAKPKHKRTSCEAQARRRYRVGVKAKRSTRSPTEKGRG